MPNEPLPILQIIDSPVKYWNFTLPEDDDQPLQLLTIAGISVCGYWEGAVGEYYSAWSFDLQYPLHCN